MASAIAKVLRRLFGARGSTKVSPDNSHAQWGTTPKESVEASTEARRGRAAAERGEGPPGPNSGSPDYSPAAEEMSPRYGAGYRIRSAVAGARAGTKVLGVAFVILALSSMGVVGSTTRVTDIGLGGR